MARIEISNMELEKRERFTLTVGSKQDRARALFTGLLPPGDTCYTASEVVKFSLSTKADYPLYVTHYKALNSLARLHGLADGKNPGPDNVDENGRRLPGTKPGKLQPCKWNRDNWLSIVSDENYEWLLEFNQRLETLTATSPPGSTYSCELDSFGITIEAPAKPEPAKALPDRAPVPLVEDKPMPKRPRFRCNRYIITALGGLASAVMLFVILWPWVEPGKTADRVKLLNVENYLKQNNPQLEVIHSTPISTTMTGMTWQACERESSEMYAMTQPPPMFIANNR